MKLIPAQAASLPKIYRHFAVITLVCTAILAMVVDGENRRSVADKLHERQQMNHMKAAEVSKMGARTLFDPVPVYVKFGSASQEFDSTYGAPTDREGAKAEDGVYPRQAAIAQRPQVTPKSYGMFGMSKEEWEALSEEERQRLMDTLASGQMLAEQARRNGQLERLMQQSDERAGKATTK